jgi:hypothetical protein
MPLLKILIREIFWKFVDKPTNYDVDNQYKYSVAPTSLDAKDHCPNYCDCKPNDQYHHVDFVDSLSLTSVIFLVFVGFF